MRPLHLSLAVLVAAVWGVNFVVIDVGLDHFPPLLFTALRFVVAALPAVFFVRRPRVALVWVVLAGLTLGVAKFGLVFTGMHLGMPAGLTSLVLQVQAVFTAAFAVVFLGERLRPLRYAGMGVALAGIGVAAWAQGASGPLTAFAMIVGAAAFWGLANVITRKAAPPDALSWTVWMSLVPPLPLFALSLLVEGPQAGLAALRGLDWAGVGALLFVAWVATVLGFGVWGFLLREHDASAVAPFTLLVPVFGMLSALVFLGEAITPLNLLAAVLLVGGVALTALGGARRPAAPGPAGPGPGEEGDPGLSAGRTPGRAPSADPGR
ncbi:EamA family transporter [Nocardiopsis flavescens]|uniref:O-acetylserine/cysteine efflux transporter n=1 Tax=Nocardiopsis flavescens TaxID=758803 RepID=A0A1M6HL10_9ACTN|nr:EamA family transporter [Nocardiopsis flavescens]SHJ22839.1 O-acetylserine/cysteine efflux transporter [Nocardiopsis flavescens]